MSSTAAEPCSALPTKFILSCTVCAHWWHLYTSYFSDTMCCSSVILLTLCFHFTGEGKVTPAVRTPLLLLLPVSEAQVWPWVYVPKGGFWPRARGPCRQARSDVANNLQMLACIRAWQLVMSPPTLPHSSITSHLLPNTSWGREGGADTATMRLDCPSTQIRDNTSQH